MFGRLGKILVIVALAIVLGAHWSMLQMAAWTTMLADNLQCASFHDAMVRTFDGQHPCPICKAIAAAKKSEQKTKFATQAQKFEFPPIEDQIVLIGPFRFQLSPRVNTFAHLRILKPPTPPPRGFFA